MQKTDVAVSCQCDGFVAFKVVRGFDVVLQDPELSMLNDFKRLVFIHTAK